MTGKRVLVVNDENGETKIFDSIAMVYEFISQRGFDKRKRILYHYLTIGQFQFKEYTFEKLDK